MWRVQYSLCLSSLRCDFFEGTPAGGGEVLARFPVRKGGRILAGGGGPRNSWMVGLRRP